MSQQLLVKPTMAQAHPLLSLNMPDEDELFPCFASDDFASLYGSPLIAKPLQII